MRGPQIPMKHSPVHHKLIQAGAIMAEVFGWLAADHFGDAGSEAEAVRSRAGLSDLSLATKWEIKGTGIADFVRSLGVSLPEPGRAALADFGYVCRPNVHQVLFIFEREAPALVSRLTAKTLSPVCAHALDRTSGFGRFLLCGPMAQSVLRKLTALDLREAKFPALSCAWTPMAAIRVLLVHKDRNGLAGYEIFFGREYGEYFWEAVRGAGEEFHLRPFGLQALQLLEP